MPCSSARRGEEWLKISIQIEPYSGRIVGEGLPVRLRIGVEGCAGHGCHECDRGIGGNSVRRDQLALVGPILLVQMSPKCESPSEPVAMNRP